MVKIFEYKYPYDSDMGDFLQRVESRIAEFDSFEEYLNLLAVQRTGFPEYYRNITRHYDLEKQESLTKIALPLKDDWSDWRWYYLFAKVIS